MLPSRADDETEEVQESLTVPKFWLGEQDRSGDKWSVKWCCQEGSSLPRNMGTPVCGPLLRYRAWNVHKVQTCSPSGPAVVTVDLERKSLACGDACCWDWDGEEGAEGLSFFFLSFSFFLFVFLPVPRNLGPCTRLVGKHLLFAILCCTFKQEGGGGCNSAGRLS